jgi:cytochrome c peroxidase
VTSRAQWMAPIKPMAVARLAILSVLAMVGTMLSAASEDLVPRTAEPIAPVPTVAPLDPAKVRLGERLFRDVRLSHDNRRACASCHRLDRGGDDGQVRSIGADGRPLDFNTPTVFNAALSFRLNWRGNFRTLEEQAEAVLLDTRLMATSWAALIAKLRADQTYRDAFNSAYGQPPARPLVLDALAAFERSLVTPRAPFDRYLRGESDAIGPEEKRGYELFKSHGCAACHQGVNVGGNLFQRFGIFDDPVVVGPPTKADLGRFALTGKAEDRSVFRVPSLRNVARTAPYFHDGRVETLEQAVEEMARTQLGRRIAPREVDLIVRFLHTLTGEYRPMDGRGTDQAGAPR